MENAIKILISAVELAQKRGAYNLEEAAQIIGAINVLKTPAPKETVEKVEDKKEKK